MDYDSFRFPEGSAGSEILLYLILLAVGILIIRAFFVNSSFRWSFIKTGLIVGSITVTALFVARSLGFQAGAFGILCLAGFVVFYFGRNKSKKSD